MASAVNTSGPAPQRKERCTLQCALSLKEEKFSYLRAVLSTTSIRLVQNIPSRTPIVPPTKNDWDSFFQPMFDEYFKPLPNVDHPVPEVHTPVPAALTSSPSSTTIDQDVPSTSTSLINQEIQS
ncbi:hypothetical protein Tco_0986828 [Tanacetum coccineum]